MNLNINIYLVKEHNKIIFIKYCINSCLVTIRLYDLQSKNIKIQFSRQHAAKLNKPELATAQDNTTITIDDYGMVKDKDRDCRGYYPKYEQEVSFKGVMTGVRKVSFFNDIN